MQSMRRFAAGLRALFTRRAADRELDGLIKADWQPTENNRRAKYYSLTARGRARLKSDTRDWQNQTAAIARILEASLGEL